VREREERDSKTERAQEGERERERREVAKQREHKRERERERREVAKQRERWIRGQFYKMMGINKISYDHSEVSAAS
jgi:hypothetical protein